MSVKLRKRKQGNGKVRLYLDIYQDGKRRYEYPGLFLTMDKIHNKETMALATSIAAKRQLELQSNPHGYVPEFKKNLDFMAYFESLALRKDKCWHSTLFHLKSFQTTPLPFKALTPGWLEKFKSYLCNTVSLNSANIYYSKIKAALHQALKDRLINENPTLLIAGIRKSLTHRTYLSSEELGLLAKAPCLNSEVRRAFFFSCYTGLRISDIRHLTWKKIQGTQIHFHQQKTRGIEYLPLSEMAKALLGPRGEDILPVFQLPKGDWTIWNVVKIWGKSANLQKEISFHVSRHTFATLALSSGVDIYTVSKLLGHSDLKHTQIYAQVIDERKNQPVNLLPSLSL